MSKKKLILYAAIALILVAAVCWFLIPRPVLPSNASAEISGVWNNGNLLNESSYSSEALAAVLQNARYRPCFMETVPDTVPEWDVAFRVDSRACDIFVYENMTILRTWRPQISYRILEPDALIQSLNQIAEGNTA